MVRENHQSIDPLAVYDPGDGGRSQRSVADATQILEEFQSAFRKIALILEELRVSTGLLTGSARAHSAKLLQRLSPREWEVLEELRAAKRADEIAAHLCISPHTVRNHTKSIFRKLDVHSHIELLRKIGPSA